MLLKFSPPECLFGYKNYSRFFFSQSQKSGEYWCWTLTATKSYTINKKRDVSDHVQKGVWHDTVWNGNGNWKWVRMWVWKWTHEGNRINDGSASKEVSQSHLFPVIVCYHRCGIVNTICDASSVIRYFVLYGDFIPLMLLFQFYSSSAQLSCISFCSNHCLDSNYKIPTIQWYRILSLSMKDSLNTTTEFKFIESIHIVHINVAEIYPTIDWGKHPSNDFTSCIFLHNYTRIFLSDLLVVCTAGESLQMKLEINERNSNTEHR